MDTITRFMHHAEDQCKKHGKRLTEKRRAALLLLLKTGKALSAYDLVEAYRLEYGEGLPAMSMYRILDFLAEEHLVHRLELVNKYVACAHIACSGRHVSPQFLICTECDKVEEVSFDEDTLKALKNQASNAGFYLEKPSLELNAICHDCRSNAEF